MFVHTFDLYNQQPEGPSTEDPSTQESDHDHGRVFTTQATVKIKHLRREELILLTAKQLLHGAKGRKTANTHPESAPLWVSRIGWALGRLLIVCRGWVGVPKRHTVDTEIQVKLIPPTYLFAFAFAFSKTY